MINKDTYNKLPDEGKYIYDLIEKYHNYFSKKDKFYRWVVRIFKIIVLLLAMVNTIVLGLKGIIDIDNQVIVGLCLSSVISFVTAITAYFNFEEYWMRNIKIHIELNIIRDNFIYDAESKLMDNVNISVYKIKLEDIQKENIEYWNKSLKRI